MQLTFKEHFLELRRRFMYVVVMFIISFGISYVYSDYIYQLLLMPLAPYYKNSSIIYTGLTEAFFTYLSLSCYCATLITLPFAIVHGYLFAEPGLRKDEKVFILPHLIAAPILFFLGAFIAYYFIFPNAWSFFLSFENTNNSVIPIKLEARISEYLSLSLHLMIGFGLAFQLPVLLNVLVKIGVISTNTLQTHRRFAIVSIFIIAAIITPPDVLSQVLLASIMIALYELCILSSILYSRRASKNARH